MEVRKVSINATIKRYEAGMGLEDGFEFFSDIVTRGEVAPNMLIKIEQDDGRIVCPYIETGRGRSYIREEDYVIVDEYGEKYLCGKDQIWLRYEKVKQA